MLRPPPPRQVVADVAAAVREALRFPLAGPPLEELVRGGGARDDRRRAAEPADPRRADRSAPGRARRRRRRARAARACRAQQTILVACGLGAPGRARGTIGASSPPSSRGASAAGSIVHDAEDPDLVELGIAGNVPLRVNRALVETDVVVAVTAAETVLHGGPAALARRERAPRRSAPRARARCSRRARRRAGGSRVDARAAARRARAADRRLARAQPPALGGVVRAATPTSEDGARADRALAAASRALGSCPGRSARGCSARCPAS